MTNGAAEIEEQAASWLTRRDAGNWSDADQRALEAWVAQSTANRVALLRLETAWTKADRLRVLPVSQQPSAETEDIGAEEMSLSRPQRRWLWPSAAAAVLALMAVPAYREFFPASESYSTPVGGFQRLPLADGSGIELNTDTKLDVHFTRAERRVTLAKGEAFFKVAHDRSRPFVVEAGPYRVIAVGTAFTVRRAGDDVDVVVTEGRVRLEGRASSQKPPAFVSAGQSAVAATATEMPVVRADAPDEVQAALSWRDGLLVFDHRPLGEVAAEFNRYNRRQLIVDPSATDVVIDGTFRATNIDAFVRLLHEGFGVNAATEGDNELILKRA